jgi:hypothetical protein
VFGFRYRVKEENTSFQSLRELISITQFQLFLALIISTVLLLVDGYLFRMYPALGFIIPDDSDYVTLFATISGIGGVFIGLYYAGVSTVGSAIYSRVPNNIRDLLARDRIGNVYMRYLSFITFISLCFIALRVLGYPRIHLAVIIGLLGSGIGIIAFVKLGQRAFNLFDPTELSYHVFEELKQFLNSIRAGGYRWDDPSFQHHANRRATAALETLGTLADICAEQTHLSGKPFVDLNKNLLRFLINYERSKKSIPSESRWYEQRYKHKDWYKTQDTVVTIAHKTGTLLQPDVTTDKVWVEKRLLPVISRCFTINLKGGRNTIASELMSYIDSYLKVLSASGELKEAFRILKDLGDTVFKEIGDVSQEAVLEKEQIEKLGLAEFMAYLPVSILLSYIESIENLTEGNISQKLSRIKWKRAYDIYENEFPAYCLPRLEWFKSRINYETAIEGIMITPIWYQSELISQVEAEQLDANSSELISNAINQYKEWITKMDASKHPWLSSAILSREWEYWNKASIHIHVVKQKWDDLCVNRRIKGLAWPEWQIDKLDAAITDRKKDILRQMSQRSIVLTMTSRPEGFPDYSGQFLHTAGETIYEALYRGDLELFKALYKHYFIGCLLKFEKLRPKAGATDWRSQLDFKIAAAPLLDLIDLSGYACLFADYHKNPLLWSETTSVWDEYLNEKESSQRVNLFAAAISITDMSFEIAHRSVLRTSWHQGVSRRLQDVPRKEVYHRGRPIGYSTTLIQHESALVRIFARDQYGSFHDGIDIFITLYLRSRPEAKDLTFGRNRRNFQDALQDEDERYKSMAEADQGEMNEA